MRYSQKYLDYLHSEEWNERRIAKLQMAKFRCEHCHLEGKLEVHHLNYDRLGHEDTRDLIVLCESCHQVADWMRRWPKSKLERELAKPVLSSKQRKNRARKARRKAARLAAKAKQNLQ